MHKRRRPAELLKMAVDWAKKTGWPSRWSDWSIADQIYQRWIAATDVEWRISGHRDRELLSEALHDAYRTIHSDPAVDYVYALIMAGLELRGRRDGVLQRNRNH